MERTELKGKLEEIYNHASAAKELSGEIIEFINDDIDDCVFDTLESLRDCEITAEDAHTEITNILDFC